MYTGCVMPRTSSRSAPHRVRSCDNEFRKQGRQSLSKLWDGFLRRQQPEALLARHALLGELIVGAEPRGVRRLRGAPVGRGFLGSTCAVRTMVGAVSRGVTFREGFFPDPRAFGLLRLGRVG